VKTFEEATKCSEKNFKDNFIIVNEELILTTNDVLIVRLVTTALVKNFTIGICINGILIYRILIRENKAKVLHQGIEKQLHLKKYSNRELSLIFCVLVEERKWIVHVSINGLLVHKGLLASMNNSSKLKITIFVRTINSRESPTFDVNIWHNSNLKRKLQHNHLKHAKITAYPAYVLKIGIADATCVYVPYLHKLFFGGGYGPTSIKVPLSNWFVYDLEKNDVYTLKPMPLKVWGVTSVFNPLDNKIYVFGGSTIGKRDSNIYVQIYDIENNKWSVEKGPFSIGRGAMAAFDPLFKKIHIISGGKLDDVVHVIFDPINNEWKEKKIAKEIYRFIFNNKFNGRRWASLTFYDGKLWLFGGRIDSRIILKFSNEVFIYDIINDSWKKHQKMPTKALGMIREFGWLNGKFILNNYQYPYGNFHSDVFSYDPEKDVWEHLGYGLFPSDGCCGYIDKNGVIYIVGGRDNVFNPVRALPIIEARIINEPKIVVFSSYSDTYGKVGTPIHIKYLDENNEPLSKRELIIFRNGTEEETLLTNENGYAKFIPQREGIYFIYDEDRRVKSNKMVVVSF